MATTAKLNFKISKTVYWVCMKSSLQLKGKKMTCNIFIMWLGRKLACERLFLQARRKPTKREFVSHLECSFNEFIQLFTINYSV